MREGRREGRCNELMGEEGGNELAVSIVWAPTIYSHPFEFWHGCWSWGDGLRAVGWFWGEGRTGGRPFEQAERCGGPGLP